MRVRMQGTIKVVQEKQLWTIVVVTESVKFRVFRRVGVTVNCI